MRHNQPVRKSGAGLPERLGIPERSERERCLSPADGPDRDGPDSGEFIDSHNHSPPLIMDVIDMTAPAACSSQPVEPDLSLRRLWLIGTTLFYGGLVVLVLAALHRTTGLSIPMPDFWYGHQASIALAALAAVVAGLRLLRRDRTTTWKPAVPGRRFETAVLYTRAGCHLCDEAAAVLRVYQAWLPPVIEVDIDPDPDLMQQYSNCVPVVQFDGKVRFRGRINETLLRRLIDGTTPAGR